MAAATGRHRRDRAQLRTPALTLAREFVGADRRRLRRLRGAGRELIDLLSDFAAAGTSPLAAALGDDAPRIWRQYARQGERVRQAGEWFFYYHSHERSPPGEHGHFHVFRSLPADAASARADAPYAHLVGIGVDARGLPRRLFTTNRWVTDESWRDASDSLAALARIVRGGATDSSPLLRWLRAQLAVFQPQIERLHAHRDARVAARGGARVFEDRRMYILSECAISLDQQMAAIDSADRELSA